MAYVGYMLNMNTFFVCIWLWIEFGQVCTVLCLGHKLTQSGQLRIRQKKLTQAFSGINSQV